MKKQIKLNRLFISMLMLGCSLGFVACSDDDETTPTPPVEVTTDHMFGNYTGKMFYLTNLLQRKTELMEEKILLRAQMLR